MINVPYIYQHRGIRLSRSEYVDVVLAVLDILPFEKLTRLAFCHVPLEIDQIRPDIHEFFITRAYDLSIVNAAVQFCYEVMLISTKEELSAIKSQAGCWALVDFPPLCLQQRYVSSV